MTNGQKIRQFIIDNKLSLIGTGSSLNSVCCILSGYALHIGITEDLELNNILAEINPNDDLWKEIVKVFGFAKKNNYGEFWKSEEAKKMYKFQ